MTSRAKILAAVAAVTVTAAMTAACGTRLPDSAFTQPPGGSAPPASAAPIKIGMIDSVTSPLGADTFSGPMYGAKAFFDALNAQGGINGRQISVDACDDGASGSGNQDCVHKLIDDDHVFAFAGNSVFDYAGASYVSKKDVPDIGGEPITNAYDQYQHLYGLYGSSSPRDGTIGWHGRLYGTTETYRYFKQKLGAHTAGVVSYNQADSARFASYMAAGLRAEGYTVVDEQLDFALPNFEAAAVDMRSKGVDIVFDAIDTNGNAGLCKAIDDSGMSLVAKVTTVQSWDQTVGSTYASAPKCRNDLYATSNDLNYEDTQYPAVAQFRAAMAKYFPDRGSKLSMWELEGWASAQWLTDAIASCGSDVTHACVEAFVNRPAGYTARGLLIPVNFIVQQPKPLTHACLNVARWQDSANSGKGGWVTQVPDMNSNCFDVPSVSYAP